MFRTRNAVLASLCAGAVGLAASNGTAVATGANATGRASAAAHSGTVVMAVNSLPTNLTSIPWSGAASQTALSGLGSQLVGYNNSCAAAPTGLNVTGYLAKSLAFTKNRKGVIIKLRPLVSAAGHTLSAQDVAWSLARDMANDSFALNNLQQAGYNTKNLTKIINARTIELRVLKPSSYTIESLANNVLNIYDSRVVKSHATSKDKWGTNWLQTHLADYSGWKMESFSPGSSLTLDAVPNWGGARGNVKRLVIEAVPDAATRQQLLTAGSAQVATGLQYDQYKTLSSKSNIRVVSCRSLSRDQLLLQSATKPLTDQRVRQAISLAIDRKTIAASSYYGFADPAHSELQDAYGVKFAHPYSYNIAKAKALLKSAGYPNGFTLQITYSPTRPGPVVNSSTVLLQSELAAVGIKVQLVNVASASDFNKIFYAHTFQAYIFGDTVPLSDPAFNEYVQLDSKGPNDVTGFNSPAYDQLLARLQATPVQKVAARRAILTQMANTADQYDSILSLVQPRNLYASRKTIAPMVPGISDTILFTQINTVK